jgi:prepilin-type processing-associated H-X9-DG protein
VTRDATPQDPVTLGKAAFNEGRYEQAIAYLEQAAKSGADSAALGMLGASYSLLGRHAAAITAFERAIEMNPQSAQARHNLAVAFEQAGRRDDAIVCYREAVRLDPRHKASLKALHRLGAAVGPAAAPAARRRPSRLGRIARGLLGAVILLAAAGAGLGLIWALTGPARARGAEQRAAQCQRNLQTVTRAVLDYARAHDGTLPTAAAWTTALGPGEDSVLRCPSDPGTFPGYAMNPVLSDMRLDQIGAPERTILFFEARRGQPVLRHRGTAFYGFADGHVERLSEAPDYLWRLKRAADLGPVNPGEGAPPPAPEGEQNPSPNYGEGLQP